MHNLTEIDFLDLCTWLSDDKKYSAEQLDRLQNETHYLKLIELANNYWLTAHLTNQLKKHSVWASLPEQLQNYLTQLELGYHQRSENIQQEIINICQALRKVTSPLVLLKGGASLFNGVTNPISNRYMADIDILVPKQRINDCVDKLLAMGYKRDLTDSSIETEDFHHAAPMIRDQGPCYVELHRRPLVNSLKNILNADEAMSTSISLELAADLVVEQMHPTQQIIHSIAHSELQDSGYAEAHIDLRQLLNFYLIAKTFDSEICWNFVEQRFADTNQTHVLQSCVYHANKLLGLPISIANLDHRKCMQQYQACIQAYSEFGPEQSRLSDVGLVLKGYSRETIINLYGEQGHFPILRGRLRHLKRHIYMLMTGKEMS